MRDMIEVVVVLFGGWKRGGLLKGGATMLGIE